MKILIIKRDKIGDMLLVTPMLEHLRASRPDAQIHMLANDYNAWIVEATRTSTSCGSTRGCATAPGPAHHPRRGSCTGD